MSKRDAYNRALLSYLWMISTMIAFIAENILCIQERWNWWRHKVCRQIFPELSYSKSIKTATEEINHGNICKSRYSLFLEGNSKHLEHSKLAGGDFGGLLWKRAIVFRVVSLWYLANIWLRKISLIYSHLNTLPLNKSLRL